MVSLSVQNGAYIHFIYAKQSNAQSINSKGMGSLSAQNGLYTFYAKLSAKQRNVRSISAERIYVKFYAYCIANE